MFDVRKESNMVSQKEVIRQTVKLFENKEFQYFIYFLSTVNIVGFIANRKLNAIFFFLLVTIISAHFMKKHLAGALTIALITTSLIATTRVIREGMTDSTSTSTTENDEEADAVIKNIAVTNPGLAVAAAKLNETNDVVAAKASLMKKKNRHQLVSGGGGGGGGERKQMVDVNNPDMTSSVEDDSAVEAFGNKMVRKPKIDYSTTMNDAYANLNSLLGSGGVNKLTEDTKQLLNQQKELFSTMQSMVPALSSAQDMMSKFNVNDLMSSITKK